MDELMKHFHRVWNCKGRHWNHGATCRPDDPCFNCEYRWEAVLTDKEAQALGFEIPVQD